MRILFTICGRAGSKGIKNKNIRMFLGKPLPFYTMSAIDLFLKNTELELQGDIAVNTDSPELIELMSNNPFRTVDIVDRRDELAGDSVGKIKVIEDTFIQMSDRKGKQYDLVVDLDITSPLRKVEDIQKLIVKHIQTNADVTTSVVASRRNPYFNQVIRAEKGFRKVIQSDFTARQQAPEIFDMNASLYAFQPEFLCSGKGVLDGYCECIEMYDTGVLDLDHENDFELMEIIAEYLYRTQKDFAEIYNHI